MVCVLGGGRYGEEPVNKKDISSLRVLGTVGEPINPEAWRWYHKVVGKSRCSIVDTYWQTETGGHMLTPLPGWCVINAVFCIHFLFEIQLV